MPIAIDPEAKIRIILDSDIDKKDAVVFLCRALTGRQQRQITEALDKIADLSDTAAIDETFRVLSLCVVGWEGYPEPFDKDKLMDLMGTFEAVLLIRKVLYAGPSWADRKKSVSPSDVSTAESAKSVPV
jgi:hypothetical protein